MVIFDTTFLTFMFVPNAQCGVDHPKDRADFLIADLHGAGERIGIPTPALSEVLIRTGHSTQLIIHELKRSCFQVLPFDTLAAIELAQLSIEESKKGPKRGDSQESWAKVKFDRQIIAIARVHRARAIYSEDPGLRKFAESLGITVKSISECPRPYALQPASGRLFPEEENESETSDESTKDSSAVQGSGSGHPEGQTGNQETSSQKEIGEEKMKDVIEMFGNCEAEKCKRLERGITNEADKIIVGNKNYHRGCEPTDEELKARNRSSV